MSHTRVEQRLQMPGFPVVPILYQQPTRILFELLMLHSLSYSSSAGFRLVFGGMRPDRKFWPMLQELGFVHFGEPQLAILPEGSRMDQPLVAHTHPNAFGWKPRTAAVIERLNRKGYIYTPA